MCLAKIVFAVFVCTSVINNVFVSGDDDDENKEAPEEKTDPPPLDNHSFVALIDILFTDGSKRSCTGTIIHDNAVITAAHCFLTHEPGYVDVEMSGSFVVIGTKKMFDTGYENYLPIERIITHPRYRGWTANLALVFTFAGMTTEKPGNVIPLSGEGSSTPVDSNVTILSWGRCSNEEEEESVTKWNVEEKKKRKCSDSEENHDSCEQTTYRPRKVQRSGSNQLSNEPTNSQERIFRGNKKNIAHHTTPAVESTNRTSHHSPKAIPMEKHKTTEGIDPQDSKEAKGSKEVKRSKEVKGSRETKGFKEAKGSKELKRSKEAKESKEVRESKEAEERRDFDVTIGTNKRNNSIRSHYFRTVDKNKTENLIKTLRRQRKHRRIHHLGVTTVKAKDQNSQKEPSLVQRRGGSNVSLDGHKALKYYYKDWRRKSKSHGPKENKLTVEAFGFVNVQTCKKIVDKTMPPDFAINTNEVVCYAAEEHYISDDDSGAPAVRQGHLVAVTVGGAQCDGDHVAIGMRMNCFCSWIVENLPPGDNIMECCEDCCKGTKKKESRDDAYYRQRHRKHSKKEEDK